MSDEKLRFKPLLLNTTEITNQGEKPLLIGASGCGFDLGYSKD